MWLFERQSDTGRRRHRDLVPPGLSPRKTHCLLALRWWQKDSTWAIFFYFSWHISRALNRYSNFWDWIQCSHMGSSAAASPGVSCTLNWVDFCVTLAYVTVPYIIWDHETLLNYSFSSTAEFRLSGCRFQFQALFWLWWQFYLVDLPTCSWIGPVSVEAKCLMKLGGRADCYQETLALFVPVIRFEGNSWKLPLNYSELHHKCRFETNEYPVVLISAVLYLSNICPALPSSACGPISKDAKHLLMRVFWIRLNDL